MKICYTLESSVNIFFIIQSYDLKWIISKLSVRLHFMFLIDISCCLKSLHLVHDILCRKRPWKVLNFIPGGGKCKLILKHYDSDVSRFTLLISFL